MMATYHERSIADRLACVPSGAAVQQAETGGVKRERFLQVAEPTGQKNRQKLMRVPFQVSRLMEFCTLRELQNQTGHCVGDWPLVVLKELLDNALDACEELEVAPVVTVSVAPKAGTIMIQDNGPGIAEETIRAVCDYSIRVSSREAYVSPSRGAQGNALKTVIAMGYVLDREKRQRLSEDFAEATARTVIETRGIAHTIVFDVDHVTNEPRIAHTTTPSLINIGARITVNWPPTSEGLGLVLEHCEDSLKALAGNYVWFNPHLSLRGEWDGVDYVNVAATNPNWTKWRPSDPTSPHWYNETRLQRYLSAHVARDRHLGQDRPVREFITEFRGLSGTRKQRAILAEIRASRQSLGDFFGRDKVNREGIGQLLMSMKRHSAPVPPKHLGVIGKDHLQERFLAAGGARETFRYERQTGISGDIPFIVECAFGLRQSGLDGGTGPGRLIVSGANWSIGIHNPFRRFGRTGEGLEGKLAEVRANQTQPVILALHLASAHIQYADRGKSSIIVEDDLEPMDV